MDKMKNRIEVKPDIIDGDVGLDDSYLDPKNAKLRITAWIDGDIYNELQKRAKAGEANGKYQTLMNDILRAALFGHQEVKPVENAGTDLPKRVAQAVAKMFKQESLVMEKIVAQTIDGKFREFKKENSEVLKPRMGRVAKSTKKRVASRD